jgi:hypothetical protein
MTDSCSDQAAALQVTSCPCPSTVRTRAAGAAIGVSLLIAIATNNPAALVSLAFVAIVLVIARAGLVRTSATALARCYARRRQEAARLRAVRRAGPMRELQYLELRRLVRSCDQLEASRFDLDGLLDEFARLSLAHAQDTEALAFASCLDSPPSLLVSERRQQINKLRLEQRQRCAVSVMELADAIEVIDNLVRLIVQQRAMSAQDLQFEQGIDRRLADLEEIERAQRQLDNAFAR